MLTQKQLWKINKASATFDLVITWGFATPWTFLWIIGLLTDISARYEISGVMIEPDVFHIFFANLMGSVVVVWAVVRLMSDDLRLVRYDAAARYLFSTWMVFALMSGASRIIIVILVIEFTLAVIQSLPLNRT